jgi:hypothetical protein
MFKRIGYGILAGLLFFTAIPAFAQAPYADKCVTGLKQSVQYAGSTATTTSLIAPVTGSNVYICGFAITQAGGTGTLAVEYGTGATCGTGTQLLSATYTANSSAGTSSYITSPNHGFTQIDTVLAGVAVPSQRICVVSTGRSLSRCKWFTCKSSARVRGQ